MANRIHCMTLKAEEFEKIESGKKTVELRLFDEKRRMLETGDFIVFKKEYDDSEIIAVRITGFLQRDFFEELFPELNVEECGFPNGTTKREVRGYMGQFYSDEDVIKNGVLAIQMKKTEYETAYCVSRATRLFELYGSNFFDWEKEILEYYYGIEDGNLKSIEDVMDKYFLTRNEIQNLTTRLMKSGEIERRKKLRSYLE